MIHRTAERNIIPTPEFKIHDDLTACGSQISMLESGLVSNQLLRSRHREWAVFRFESATLYTLIMMLWQENIISDTARIHELLAQTQTIAVLGIKTEMQPDQPAFYVPKYLDSAGFQIIPVPVYYPQVTDILGHKVYRKLADIPFQIDMVNIFRRPEDIPSHLEEILAKRPKAVWMQSGIRHSGVAEKLAQAGIKVVQDRCLMVDHRHFVRS